MSTALSAYDVVIIGGAAVGSSAAFFLASDPAFKGTILVVERDRTYAKAATSLSSSSIRHQFSNALNVEMSRFGTAFIRGFRDAVGGEAPDLAFRENGYLFLAASAEQRAILENNHAVQSACGADVALLDRGALSARFPWLRTDDLEAGSLGLSGEGWFDNHGLLQGLRGRARALGATYVEDEVVDIVREGDRVTGVRLAGGATIACRFVVNAAGTRGARMAGMVGIDLPVEPRRRSLFVFSCRTPLAGTVPLTIDPSGVFFRPEGQYYLAGTAPRPDVAVDPDDFEVMHAEFEDEIWPALAERVPAFEAIKVVNAWAGHYDYCTLDQNVIVGPHPVVGNFLLANGFSGHGLQQSPAIGRGLSEIVIHGGYRTLDLSPLSYERVGANRPFLETAVI